MEAVGWDVRSFLNLPAILLTLGIFLFVHIVPVVKLLRRTGHNPGWFLVTLVPGLNVLALWIFAFKPWPNDNSRRSV